ncbi:MAG: hypothetical protein FWG07_00940 [Treponema sp.]|nr:hypothetical protein [Treponema sp.]
MPKIKVYLDNCVYNRPFDDQTHLRIILETQAKLFIQELIINNKIDFAWSYISALENMNNPYETRRLSIADFSKYSKQVVVESDTVIKNARQFTSNLRPTDALHVACAMEAAVDFLITTDDEMLKYKTNKLKIIDPIQFIKIWEEKENE